MRTGWIKIHRKILDNPVVTKDADHLAVWIWLLCEAAYEPHQRLFGKKKITLQPGQLITSAYYIADELDISESKVRRILNAFKSDAQIDVQTERYGRVITVLSWGKYQSDDGQVTHERRTSDARVTQTKEDKEIKKIKNNIFSRPKLDEVREYCLQKGYRYVDPDVFWNFYESKNWMVGKNKMQNWHKAIGGWEARYKKNANENSPVANQPPKKTQEEMDREIQILNEIRAREAEQRRLEREARYANSKNS